MKALSGRTRDLISKIYQHSGELVGLELQLRIAEKKCRDTAVIKEAHEESLRDLNRTILDYLGESGYTFNPPWSETVPGVLIEWASESAWAWGSKIKKRIREVLKKL